MQSKTKRVFQLRKTGSARQPNSQQNRANEQDQSSKNFNLERTSNKESNIIANDSIKLDEVVQIKKDEVILLPYPQVTVDNYQLHFSQKIKNVQVKNIKIKNVGCSAIYYQWRFKNLPKINPNAIKDPKPNFYCHYQPNVIQPGQQQIFSFSFYSQTPGVFVEQIEFIAQPSPTTSIPSIRLKGVSYIEDTIQKNRENLSKQIKQKITEVLTKQVLADILNNVKQPTPPLPDVSQPDIAERQFELANSNQKLYYNSQIHRWFTSLYNDVCDIINISKNERHWNQSALSLSSLIQTVTDPILRQSFDKRLQNYKLLSSTKPPQKSDLFPKVKQILYQVGYMLGGSIADQSKKQLEMWEIPFEQPKQTQTEQQIAVKKEERTKVIGQWAKKMKKKKWGADQQNQMLNNYRGKLEKGVSKCLMQKLNGFDDQASFESCKAKIKQKFDDSRYFGFLQRFKTVEQFPIEGKKIFLKYDLKLKENSQQALQKLNEYLQKKREEQLRLQQEKKNIQSTKNKKKAVQPKKKKGQKQQQEQKILTFDFNTLLDQQSWEGFIATLRFILEKQPFLLVIGISYGPKQGIFTQQYSIKFLLQCLKLVQPTVQFLEHKNLIELKTKIQDESINEGSIYLAQNLSFLPCECMEEGSIKAIQKIQNGQTKKVETIQSKKLLMPQILKSLDQIMPSFDIIIREDRFVNKVSGIGSYGKKNNILGLSWWRYISLSLRAQGGLIVLGGSFSADKVVLISRLSSYSKRIYLVGQIGLKIWMASEGLANFYGVKISKSEQTFIKFFLQQEKKSNGLQKITFASDFTLKTSSGTIQYALGDKVEQNENVVIDIGVKSIEEIKKLERGHLFFLGSPSISADSLYSLEAISKWLFLRKQEKKQRHLLQQSAPGGINYEKDLIVYFIGILDEDIDKVEIKERKAKKQKQGEQQEEEEDVQQQQEGQQTKKIDKICDFKASDSPFLEKILTGQFSYGLKDIDKYVKSD